MDTLSGPVELLSLLFAIAAFTSLVVMITGVVGSCFIFLVMVLFCFEVWCFVVLVNCRSKFCAISLGDIFALLLRRLSC